MVLVGTVSLISKASQPWEQVNDADLLAVGGNKAYYSDSAEYFLSLDLDTGAAVRVTHGLDMPNQGCVVSSGMSKSGYIDFEVLHVKAAETVDSRYLYLTHVRIDASTLAVVSSSTKQLTGPVLNQWTYKKLVLPNTDLVFLSHVDINNLIVVNLNNLTYWLSATSGSGYMQPDFLLTDRTTHKPYIFWQQHYWIVGAYTRCGIYDPALDVMTLSQAFDANAGAMAYPELYEDSDRKLHFIYTGTSSGAALGARYSKYYLMYVNNGALASEITAVGGTAYTSGTCADICPHILGVTPDNTLAMATAASRWNYTANNSPAFTASIDLIECTNLLASPSKISIVTDAVPVNSNVVRLTPLVTPSLFLLEQDWSYRLPLQIYPYDPTTGKGTMKIAKIALTTDLTPNPYGVIVVPT